MSYLPPDNLTSFERSLIAYFHRLGVEVRLLGRLPPGSGLRLAPMTLPDRLVTLAEIAALLGPARTRLLRVGPLPTPAVLGGFGHPARWSWSELRPWLERRLRVKLPEVP